MLKYCHTCHYGISKPKVLRFVIYIINVSYIINVRYILAIPRSWTKDIAKYTQILAPRPPEKQGEERKFEKTSCRFSILGILQYSTIRYPMKLCALCFPKGAWTPGEWGKSPLPCLFFHHKLKSRPLCRLSSFSCLILLERESSLFHLVIKKRA